MGAWITLTSDFIDDVIVTADTLEEILEMLKELIKHNLTTEFHSKCKFVNRR